jgi:hypothetical protein
MRSLWRLLALQWLGGEGSEALAGDPSVLETLLSLGSGERSRAVYGFDVRRVSGVSHRAMLSQIPEARLDPETASSEAFSGSRSPKS